MSSIFFTTPPRVRLFAACARASAGGDDERGDDDYNAIERAISSILESAPETLSSVEENGVTPLMVAVEANNVAAVDALCRFARKEGGDEGFVECESIALDQTALIVASSLGHEKSSKNWSENTARTRIKSRKLEAERR